MENEKKITESTHLTSPIVNPSAPNDPTTGGGTGTGAGTNTPADSATDGVSQEKLATQIIERLMPEIQALQPDELIQVNVDVPAAVALVFGSLPGIQSYRDEIVKSMPGFDIARFDKLEDYVIALNDAHADYQTATQPKTDLDKVLEEGVRTRDLLHSDASALVERGLLEAEKLNELSGTVGHKNLASDLSILAKVLIAAWPQIQGKTAVQEPELERARKLGQHVIRAVGLREQVTAKVAAATDLRARIFTLFSRCYDSVRRAIGFLRWDHRDSEKIAPSIYSGRARRGASEVVTDPPPAGTTPGTGSPAGNVPGTGPGNGTTVPQSSVIPAGHQASADAGAEHAEFDSAAGTPGSNPFMGR